MPVPRVDIEVVRRANQTITESVERARSRYRLRDMPAIREAWAQMFATSASPAQITDFLEFLGDLLLDHVTNAARDVETKVVNIRDGGRRGRETRAEDSRDAHADLCAIFKRLRQERSTATDQSLIRAAVSRRDCVPATKVDDNKCRQARRVLEKAGLLHRREIESPARSRERR